MRGAGGGDFRAVCFTVVLAFAGCFPTVGGCVWEETDVGFPVDFEPCGGCLCDVGVWGCVSVGHVGEDDFGGEDLGCVLDGDEHSPCPRVVDAEQGVCGLVAVVERDGDEAGFSETCCGCFWVDHAVVVWAKTTTGGDE